MTSLINEQPNPKKQQSCVISIRKTLSQYFQMALLSRQRLDQTKHAFNFITHFNCIVPGNQIVKLNWIIEVQPDSITILVVYIQWNGWINFLSVRDERMSQQVRFLLKNVNRSKNHQFKYVVTQNNIITLRFIAQTNQLKRIVHNQLKAILKSIHFQVSCRFTSFLPFLVYYSTFLRQIFRSYDIFHQQQMIKVDQMKFIERLQLLKRKFEQTKRHRQQAFQFQSFQYNKQIHNMFRISNLIANDMFSFKLILERFNAIQLTYQSQKKKTEYNSDQKQQDKIVSGIRILSEKKAQMKTNRGGNGAISFQLVRFQLLNTINQYEHTARSQVKMNFQKTINGINSNQKKKNEKNTSKSLDDTREDKCYNAILKQNSVGILQAHLAKKIPIPQSKTAKNSFQNQVALLGYIRGEKCSSIGKYFIDLYDDTKIYMEIYSQNLSQLLKKNKKISITQKLRLALKIAQGVWFLHTKMVCHRDLKPQNIMINQSEGCCPKIIDFGSMCVPTGKGEPFFVPQDRLLSTKGYYIPYEQAPQQLRKIYSKFEYQKHQYFDCYSLGRIFQKIFQSHKGFQLQNYKQSIINEYIQFIVGNCLDPNPMNRLSAELIYRFIQILIEIDSQGWTNIQI